MGKKTVYLLGCSFTDMVKHHNTPFFEKFRSEFNIINLAYLSRSNFQILEDVKSLPSDSVVFIQWSALTRPDGNPDYEEDWNKELNKLAFSNENPLKFLINNFIKIVSEANKILVEKNIKSFQYIGWVQWNDSELDDDLISKLKNLPINWFSTPKVNDVMPSNCWEYDSKSLVNKIKNLLGGNIPELWEWKSFSYGGMSEWIRFNVKDPYKRYIAIKSRDGYDDSHPSSYASEQFYINVILPELYKMI